MSWGPELREEAIVLSTVDYGESDRIVNLLSRERGRLAAFVRGARKSRRRFAGALEPFTRLEVQLAERRGSELYLLRACSILDAHFAIRADLEAIAHAGHAAELCRELTKEKEPVPDFYELLQDYLARLCEGAARPEALLAFELLALGHAGLAPRLDACSLCGKPWKGAERPGPQDPPLLFDAGHGGLVCSTCRPQAFPGALHVAAPVIRAALVLQREGPATALRLEDEALRSKVREVVRRFTQHVLGRPPRSLAFFQRLGLEG